ncbi:hypothetical protein [Martelella alba]|uniref:Uncharacterized protein n=1 Tax=Martelella alba TaxID=2590451 RepID=A0ABY2SFR2_9HYPH|nr:hypothetical protein [Martelella alba]TKI02923.1 hypothetical protein FCN80_23435 [Martelella alba]
MDGYCCEIVFISPIHYTFAFLTDMTTVDFINTVENMGHFILSRYAGPALPALNAIPLTVIALSNVTKTTFLPWRSRG